MIDQSALSARQDATTINAETRKKKKSGWVARLTSPFEIVSEFAQLTKRTGRAMWLIPMMGVFMLLALLLAVIQVIEYVAPFVYTIF